MQRAIISDTSCLVILSKINELDLLHQIFGEIIVTKEIVDEYKSVLPDWFIIKAAKNSSFQKVLEINLDKGESSAIALAVEIENCLLILDDLKGRKYANQLGIKITGTIGIIVDAKRSGHIGSIKPILEKINQTNFRLSDEIIKQALIEACEEK